MVKVKRRPDEFHPPYYDLDLYYLSLASTGAAKAYEEDVWTPAITFATPGNLSVAYSTQVGTYTKIGRLVTLTGDITTSTFTHTTASGDLQITGVPYAARTLTGYFSLGGMQAGGWTKAGYTSVASRIRTSDSFLNVALSGSGSGVSQLQAADMPTGGLVVLRFTLSYEA